MFGWTHWAPRELSAESDRPALRYRAEVRSRDNASGGELHLYDGGDFSPYCIESLLNLLRSETRASGRALEMTLEILGPCSTPRLEEVTERFAKAAITGLSVTVRAPGHPPMRVDDSAPIARPAGAGSPRQRSS
jgi:hypothetical protein